MENKQQLKKALILGTLSPQADAARYLKSAGWWVIGCGHRKYGRALEIIDQFELVDITDFDAVEDLARRENVRLIYSAGSEVAMPTISAVAPKLGLVNFVLFEIAQLLHDKIELRKFLWDNKVSPVPFRKLKDQNDLYGWDIFPAMVKPTDSQGQRGVFRAETLDEARAGLGRTLEHSSTRTAIIEKYLDGPEMSANTFVIDGQMVFCEISDRLVVEEFPGGIPRGHVMPSRNCSGDLLVETKRLVEDCVHLLNIQNGPVYFQMKLTTDGPRIIEIMPRFDGCHIWRLIKVLGGVDLIEACFRLLDGDKNSNVTMDYQPGVYQLMFWHSPEGVFEERNYPVPSGAIYYEYRYHDGDLVKPGNGYLDVVGYYVEKQEGLE